MTDTGPSAAFAPRRRGGFSSQPPEQALQLQQIATNTSILAQVNPWMTDRPDVIMQLAQSGASPDQLASHGAALYGMQNMDALRSSLESLTATGQRSVYNKLTEQQQAALTQMGYSRPDDPDSGGFMSTIAGAAGSVVSTGLGGLSAVGRPVGGAALDALTWIGDRPAHLYRTIRTMDDWQQWAALGGAVAGIALAIPTMGGSLAFSGMLVSAGILGGAALGGATIAAAATNPVDWYEAMKSTYRGERTFEQHASTRAREILQDDRIMSLASSFADHVAPYDLAVDIAGQRSGNTQQQIMVALEETAKEMADVGTPEYEQIFNGLVGIAQTEQFLEAVDTLQRGKISFGRDLADLSGLSGSAHSIVSGSLDGLWAFAMDPTMAAGKITNLTKLRKFGVTVNGGEDFLERITHLSNAHPATRANHETIARAISESDFTLMPAAARGLWTPLNEYKRAMNLEEFGREDLLKFIETGDGMNAILEGKATIRGLEQAVVNTKSESRGIGRVVRELRGFRNAVDDVTLEREFRRMARREGVERELDEVFPRFDTSTHSELVEAPGVAERVAGQTGYQIGKVFARVPGAQHMGQLIAALTNQAPASRAIRLVGDGAEVDVPRFVEMMGRATNLPSKVRDEWLNAIMAQGAMNQRIAVTESFLNTAFTAAGMRYNDELRDLADTYIRKNRQAYALGGLDEVALAGTPVRTGIYPEAHQAALLVMPDMIEMQKAVRRGLILKNVAKVTDSNFVEQSMSRFWKPLVLLRIGFIPRAAGEEMLAWFARMTEGRVAAEFGARTVARRSAYEAAAAAKKAGQALTPEQTAALNWKLPASLRPLTAMGERLGWGDATEAFLDTYATSLRGFLTEGVGREIPEVVVSPGLFGIGTRSAQWHHGLLYGRQHSWRRMAMNGLDPTLQRAADKWVQMHASAIMASTSSMNASVLEKTVVNPDVDYFTRADPNDPGSFIDEPMQTMRGLRERVPMGSSRYNAAIHHRIGEPFHDDVVGPAIAAIYPRFLGQFAELDDATIASHITQTRALRSPESKSMLLAGLEPREDNWRALADQLRQQDRQLGAILDDVLLTGTPSLHDVARSARNVAANNKDELAAQITEIAEDMEEAAKVIDAMEGLPVNARTWLSATISADVSANGRFFNTSVIERGVSGGRPKRVLYRGVKDASTLEVRPDGALVLKPQWNDEWGTDVVSTSMDPAHSLSYAVSPGQFNSGGDAESAGTFGIGAMIEMDGDFLASEFGTTWDQIMARPAAYEHPDLLGEFGPGMHLIGHAPGTVRPGKVEPLTAVDAGEVALVRPDMTSQLAELDFEIATLEARGVPQDQLLDRYKQRLIEMFGPESSERIERHLHTMDRDIGVLHDSQVTAFGDEAAENEQHLARLERQFEALQEWVNSGQVGAGRASHEIVIPADKWQIQDQGQMQEISQQIRDGMETRWPWLADTTWTTPDGRQIDTVLADFEQNVSRIRGGEGQARLDEMVDYLKALPEDDLDMLQQIIGFRTDRSDTQLQVMAANLVRDERHTESIAQFLSLRGQGGFEPAGWDPFFRNQEDFEAGLKAEIVHQLMRPENAEHVRMSRWSLQTLDGRPVAQPLQEGVQRVHAPVLGPNPKLDQVISESMGQFDNDVELVNHIVTKLLGDTQSYRRHSNYLQGLDQDELRGHLREAVVAYMERADARAGTWTAPMYGIGYSDARIADWVSDVLTGATGSSPRSRAYLDLPRKIDTPGAGAQQVWSGGSGRRFRMDPERDASITMIDDNGVVMLPDGSVSPGVAYTEALEDYADTIVRKLMTDHKARTRESYTIREGQTLRRLGPDGMVDVPAGTRFGQREDLFDADGNPVEWANTELFDLAVDSGDDMLWPVIGPMLRDYHEKRGGYALLAPRSTRRKLEGEQVLGDPDIDGWVTMTHSRIDDVHNTNELALPNVALSEVRTPTNDTLWDRFVRWGFQKVIGPSIDGLVRTPMSFHYYSAAYEQNMRMVKWMRDPEIFDTEIPRVFEAALAQIDSAEAFPAELMDDARRVADQFLMPVPETPEDAARLVLSLGKNNDEVVAELTKMTDAATRMADTQTMLAAERLMKMDTDLLRLTGLSDEGTNAERLVRAYVEAVPEHMWDDIDQVHAQISRTGVLPTFANDEEFETMRRAVRNWRFAEERAEEAAALRALENVVPFLDSHEQRTQFATTTRNLLPFWYAEENFLKRWGRLLANDGTMGLATMRRAQLLYMGMRSAGVVRTDVNGKDWFVYPGSGLLNEGLSKLPFFPDTVPAGVLFQTPTDQILPGVNNRFGTPSFTPFAAIGLDVVNTMFPDTVPLKRAVLGDIGAQSAALNQFVPSTVRRVWDAAFADENSNGRYASAMMTAAAMLEAEGNGLPESASPELVDEYLDKLRNHARVIMWGQAVAGFFAPGAPSAIVTGEDVGTFGWLTGLGVDSPDQLVSDQYRRYIQNLGIEEGTIAFLNEFPYADLEDVVNPLAFTTSMSASRAGAPLPATRTGMQWYFDNQEWIDSMPEAGAWFLPPDPEGDFDYYSYNQQLTNGLRKRRTPEDFIRAIKYRQGADGYFAARDQYDQAVIAVGDNQIKKNMLDDAWSTWRNTWLQTHPIFAEELVSGESRERRGRTIDQLRYAIEDPAAPDTPHAAAIAEMVRTYDQYTVAMRTLADKRDAASEKKKVAIREAFEHWAVSWAIQNPQLERLWSSVYRPEANL